MAVVQQQTEPAAAVAGVIVRGDVKDVFAWLAEPHARRGLPAERRLAGSRQRVDRRFCLLEDDLAGPAVFRPGDDDRRPRPATAARLCRSCTSCRRSPRASRSSATPATPSARQPRRPARSALAWPRRFSSNRTAGGVLPTAISVNGLDHVVRMETKRNGRALPVCHDRPREAIVRAERSSAPAPRTCRTAGREESASAAPCRDRRLDAIVGTDRHVERLLAVAVVVADEKAPAAVLVDEPAFKRPGDAGAKLLSRLGKLLLAGRQHAHQRASRPRTTARAVSRLTRQLPATTVSARRFAASALYSSSVR